jgi:hypothetical protein
VSTNSDSTAIKTIKRRIDFLSKNTAVSEAALNYNNAEKHALRLALVRILQLRAVMDEVRTMLGEGSPELKALVNRLNNFEVGEFGSVCHNGPVWSERKKIEQNNRAS